MKLRIGIAVLALAGILGVFVTTALATPGSPLTVETARGELDGSLNVNARFGHGASVKIKTRGPTEVVTQRVEIPPGGTTGWHTHPGPNVNVISRGTLTLYHAEHCEHGIAYGQGSSFPTYPDQVHLARNNGTDTLVFFATYFMPKTTPPLPIRLDAPSPGPECPL
ncbi:MAG: cupin domain-containing protein [Dehalococcoidia bacterium]